jgi:hypothetical protein
MFIKMTQKGFKVTFEDNGKEISLVSKVIILSWHMDLKGKAPIQNFKNGGYDSCGYCYSHGIGSKNENDTGSSVKFPPEKSILRSHDATCVFPNNDAFRAEKFKTSVS